MTLSLLAWMQSPETGLRETLRLVSMSDGVFYIAKVTENDLPVPFRMTRCADDLAVFENPEHEAPRKLTYKLKRANVNNDDVLEVTVEGGAMKAFTLQFARSAHASPPAH